MSFIDSEAEQAIKTLEGLKDSWDTESAHMSADEVLCDLLRDLGFHEVIDAYYKVDKWYA